MESRLNRRKGEVRTLKDIIKKLTRSKMTGVFVATIIIGIVFTIGNKNYLSTINICNMLKASSVTIVIGLAQLAVLSVGQFNLALGAIGCCSAMTYAWMMQVAGLSPIIAIIGAIAVGVLLGYIQGLLVAKSGLTPFIVTLALDSVYKGAATVIFEGQLLNKIPAEVKMINKISWGFLPLLFLIALIIVAFVEVYMNHTIFGRKMLATGESFKTAMISGLKPKDQIIKAHVLSGILAAFASIIAVSRLGAAQLSIGSDWMLMSFAAPVLGGTLLSGGHVSPVGTILGAILVNMVSFGLVIMNVNLYWSQTFMGVILIIAFAFDYFNSRVSGKSKA